MAQALFWIGQLTNAPSHCFGSAQAALRLLGKTGTFYLPSCLLWTPLLRGWRALAQQHDVAEFMQHFLSHANPPAYREFWQSRLDLPLQVVDAGRFMLSLATVVSSSCN